MYRPLDDRIAPCTARGGLPGGGCLPGGVCPGEGVSAWGGGLLGVSAQKGFLPGGLSAWGVFARGVEDTPMDRMTDMCQNINLPQLRCGR